MLDDSWTLDDLASLQGVQHVVVATSDGLVKTASSNTSREVADHLAALTTSLHSLGKNFAEHFGTGPAVRQQMTEVEGAILFVRTAGPTSCLAVVTDTSAHPGVIAQQMTLTVRSIGEAALQTPTRGEGP